MRLRPLLKAAPLLALLLALSGCLVTDKYIARVKIERDGSYRVYAEGTALDVDATRAYRALEAEERAGKLKPEDAKKRREEIDGRLREELVKLKQDKRIQELSAIGGGRVRFSVGGAWRMDRSVLIFSELSEPVSYAIGQDGAIRLRVKDAVPRREAKSLGVTTDGNLSVVVAQGVDVLEHNAQIAPKSPTGSYRWTITGPDDPQPYLKIRLPGSQARETPAEPKKGLVGHGEKS
jgi:hypothetical protein